MVDYKAEATMRLQKRGAKEICWTLRDRQISFRYISATAARNRDGSSAGMGQNPDRIILERTDWQAGRNPSITNYW